MFILSFLRVFFRFGWSDFAGVLAVKVPRRFERGSVAPLSDARPGTDDGGHGPCVSEMIFWTSSRLLARRDLISFCRADFLSPGHWPPDGLRPAFAPQRLSPSSLHAQLSPPLPQVHLLLPHFQSPLLKSCLSLPQVQPPLPQVQHFCFKSSRPSRLVLARRGFATIDACTRDCKFLLLHHKYSQNAFLVCLNLFSNPNAL